MIPTNRTRGRPVRISRNGIGGIVPAETLCAKRYPTPPPFLAQSLWAKRFDIGEYTLAEPKAERAKEPATCAQRPKGAIKDRRRGADFFALFFLPPSRLRKAGVRRLRLRRVWISKPERVKYG